MLPLQLCQITWFIITLIIYNCFAYYCLDLINMAEKSIGPENLLIFYCVHQEYSLMKHRQLFTLVAQENVCVSVNSYCCSSSLKTFPVQWLKLAWYERHTKKKCLTPSNTVKIRQVGRRQKICCWKDQFNLCQTAVSLLKRALLYKTSLLALPFPLCDYPEWWKCNLADATSASSGEKELLSAQCKANKAEIACI